MDNLLKQDDERRDGIGGAEVAPPCRDREQGEVVPVLARTCFECKHVYVDAGTARACERGHCLTLDGIFRGDLCPFCGDTYPFHETDCESKPKYCAACDAYTTHCAKDHCQECHIDEYDFPISDCGGCALLVGSIIRVTVNGSELLPSPDEIHDLIPTPHED